MEASDLKAVIAPLLTVAQAVAKVAQVGSFSVDEVSALMPLITQIVPAISAAPKALVEWKGLSLDERAQLIASCAADFQVAAPVLEQKIEAGLAVLIEAGAFLA